MQINWNSSLVKETINNIREAIGRDIEIKFKVQGSGCSYCTEDPISHMSTNSFCIYCSGLYWINTISGHFTKAHVRWTKTDIPSWQTGGTLPIGDVTVTMEYTEDNFQSTKNSDYFIVDSGTFQMFGYSVKGVPQPNRIKVSLKEINE